MIVRYQISHNTAMPVNNNYEINDIINIFVLFNGKN